MSRLFFVLLLFVSISVNACNEPIRFLYGPYVTLLMIENFLGSLHQKVSKETECKVEFTIARSFEDLTDKLIAQDHDYSLLPASYVSISLEMGYERFATFTTRNRYVYVVAKSDKNIRSLEDLKGGKLLSISPLAESGAVFEQKIRKLKLHKDIQVVYGGSYDFNLIKVLSGEADAAILISIYWEEISANIKEDKLILVDRIEINPAELVRRAGENPRNEIVMNALYKDNSFKWKKPSHELEHNKFLEDMIKAHIRSNIIE